MALYVFLLLLMFFLIFSLVRLCYLCWLHHWPARSAAAARHTPVPRLRHRHAPHTIAPPVASPAPTRLLWDLRLRLYAPGVR
jgi:hypothetical protein